MSDRQDHAGSPLQRRYSALNTLMEGAIGASVPTHDPMCIAYGNVYCRQCDCDLIKRVRADERGRVVAEFMSNHGDREAYTAALHDPLGCTLSYNKALRDAVEAVKASHQMCDCEYCSVAAIEGLVSTPDVIESDKEKHPHG